MTYKTHKAGGALCAVVGMQIMSKNNVDIEDIAPLIQFMIIYPFSLWGSMLNDLDHDWSNVADKNPVNFVINRTIRVFNSVKSKYDKVSDTTGISMSKGKEKVLKTLSAGHRSWQTHSDLTIILLLVLIRLTTRKLWIFQDIKGVEILTLILTGVLIGSLSHLILDMLTPSGINSVVLTLIRSLWRFVFKRIKKFRVIKLIYNVMIQGQERDKGLNTSLVKIRLVPKSSLFVTGSSYEAFVHRVLVIATYIYITIIVILRFIDLDSIFNLLRKIGFKI